MSGPEWMTANDVAEHLKVSISTVYRWVEEGRLKKYKTGRTTRYKKSEVDQVMGNGAEGI